MLQLVWSTKEYTAYVRALLALSIRLVQVDPAGTGSLLVSVILPLLLCRLGDATEVPDDATELLSLQLLFLSFTLVQEGQRSVFLSAILTPVCTYLMKCSVEGQASIFCGRGITHLARLCPEAFKDQVPKLSEDLRMKLQHVMKSVLENQQNTEKTNQYGTNISDSNSSANVKKIDISRYRKA